MSKRNKHDQYIDILVDMVKGKYEFVVTEQLYCDPVTKVCGEIDVLGKRGNHLDLYEVKCNDQYKKARDQMIRARGVFAAAGLEINLYYYEGKRNLLKEIL